MSSSRERNTRCSSVTGVQTCALPISIAFVDQAALATVLAVPEVRSYLTLYPDSAAKMLPASGRVIEAIRRIYPGAHEGLCQLLAKAAVGSDRLMVSVEASTGTGTARSWMTGRAQSRITGVVAAQAALETLAVPIPAGVDRKSTRLNSSH